MLAAMCNFATWLFSGSVLKEKVMIDMDADLLSFYTQGFSSGFSLPLLISTSGEDLIIVKLRVCEHLRPSRD
jgi:hypothetical protein